jgi:hypothetical protein
MEATVERFRALARSSPWRWATLRYVQYDPVLLPDDAAVRVWIRRPHLARVESLDGTVLQIHDEPTQQSVTRLTWGGSASPVTLPTAADVAVDLDDDGLVRRRPDRFELDTDTAMVGNYYDIAMLDPLELADGDDGGPGATVETLRVVEHRGREAFEAVLRPTAAYDPRCPCCSLLLSERFEDDALGLRRGDPAFVYPDAHRVRLDVQTGVCVSNEQLGGSREGDGHDIQIEAVDEPMGDELFPPSPEPPIRWPWRRRSRTR